MEPESPKQKTCAISNGISIHSPSKKIFLVTLDVIVILPSETKTDPNLSKTVSIKLKQRET